MNLNLPIDAETEARLFRLAEDAGKLVSEYVAEMVQSAAKVQRSDVADSVADFDEALVELFAGDTRKLTAMALTYSRQGMYFDHD
jgi:hypothetical protein